MRPSEADKIIYECSRKISCLFVCQNRCGAVPFAQPCLIGTQYHRKMGEQRNFVTESAVNMNLFRCVIQVVIAPDDVCDIHVYIVGNNGKIICRRPVRPHDYEVVELGIIKNNLPLNQVIHRCLSLLGHPETYRRFSVRYRRFQIPAAPSYLGDLPCARASCLLCSSSSGVQ